MLRFLRRLTVATVACGITLFWLWNTRNDQEPELNQDPEARYSWTNIRDDGHERPPLYEPKISIVSVCNVDILLAIEDALSNHGDTGEIILVCTKDEEGSFRGVIDHMRRISSIAFSIQTVEVQAPIQFSLLKAATYAIYSHVLILDSFVPLKNSSWIADTLLAPAPSGPCRYTISHPATGAGIESETIDEDVSLLFLPPFVIKRDQVWQNLNGLPKDHHLWVTFYARLFGSNNISSPTPSLFPLNALSSSFCPHVELANISVTPFKPGDPMTNTSFMVITYDLSLLHLFRETICRLLLFGNAVNVVFITGKERDVRDFEWMVAPDCYFRYLVKPVFASLDSTGSKNFDVIFVLRDGGTEIYQHLLQLPNTTILRLNSMDATSTAWMATLTKTEWKGVVQFVSIYRLTIS
ncbi:hypothetical protein FRB91_006712 [Serendipita sp. 411]|nr:hypothetical protein FRB91_006712 [Serendipita sp. 411]